MAHMYFDSPLTIGRMLRQRAAQDPDHVFCRWDTGSFTCRQLDDTVDALAFKFNEQGLGRGDRVMTMLGHHPDHIVTMLALMRLGAVVVPVNTALRGDSLNYLYRHCEPAAIVADALFADQLMPELDGAVPVLWRNEMPAGASSSSICLAYPPIAETDLARWPDGDARADDTVAICYTSGTTGPPKGVLITDKMCRCAAQSSAFLSRMKAGDTALFWDPLY
ncbi:MAG: AMP-binding protein, partial [Pollutimonas bauzanensis]